MEEKTSRSPKPAARRSGYFEIALPKVTFGNETLVPFPVVLLIALLSFLLGTLFIKVQYLQKPPLVAGNSLAAQENSAGTPTPTPVVQAKVDAGHLPVLGNAKAKVTIVEFSDFQCPFCFRFFNDTMPEIQKNYIDTGKVKFTYRHYPLTGIHPNAQKSSEAAECAQEQGKFWNYHDLLFKNQQEWSPLSSDEAISKFTEYAGQLGLDTTQFTTCITSDKYAKVVSDDEAAGTKVGVQATPTFFVNGYKLEGAMPYESFKQLIEQELKK